MKKIKITSKQYKRILRVYGVGGFFVILSLLIACAFLLGKPTEFILLFAPYMLTKGLYDYQYHASRMIRCFGLSLAVFAFSTYAVVPIRYSIVFAPAFGLLIAYISYIQGEKNFRLTKKESRVNLYELTEDELQQYCYRKGLDEIDTQIVVQRIVYKLAGQTLYDKIGYSKSQMIRREKRIEQILETKLKHQR